MTTLKTRGYWHQIFASATLVILLGGYAGTSGAVRGA